MTTHQEYEKIGETLKRESVYRSKKTGCICTEKDYSYLVLSTLQEIEEAGMAVIEDSFRNTEIWIPTGDELEGRKVFRCSKDGRLAMRIGRNRMELTEPSIVNAITTVLDSYQINIDQEPSVSDFFLTRKNGRVK